ncbi:MAG: nucleotide sugar dehydrogenase [Gemmatimonadota bacterium]|nr:nucleotide sugar dehydrogenase [Gemmatimonadota bacterium]
MSRDADLLARIESQDAVVGILGLGYVGLPLAVAFAEAGFRTLGFDVKPGVADDLNAGRSHIGDVASERLAALTGPEGRFEATTDLSRLAEADAAIICVPTPLSKTDDPDLSFVVSATESVRASLRPGQVVVLESTTYPGTTRDLVQPMLEETGLRAGEDFFLVFSPERVDPANATWHIENTPKVVGGLTPACHRLGCALYAKVIDRVVEVSSPEAAEMAKLLENTFRAVNIGLVNEMAVVADRLGIDIWEVIEAAATKPYGFMKFVPGPGLGGHCIPVDPIFLAWKMRTLQYRTRFIELAAEVNRDMPRWVVARTAEALNRVRKAVNGSRVLVLGISYKPDVDDVRESPALDVIGLLREQGAEVEFHDPLVPEVEIEDAVHRSVPLTAERLERSDAVVITTDHSAVDYGLVTRHAEIVIDPRNAIRETEGATVYPIAGPARGGAATRKTPARQAAAVTS